MRSDLLFSLRDTLRAEAFVEVVTPTVRKADLGSGRRVPVNLDQGRFLRVMIGPALRVNMKHHQRLLEIGPYYRLEKPDEVPAPEFTMLHSAPPTTTSISCSRWPSDIRYTAPRRCPGPGPGQLFLSCNRHVPSAPARGLGGVSCSRQNIGVSANHPFRSALAGQRSLYLTPSSSRTAPGFADRPKNTCSKTRRCR
ncbi:amino acid--tRNA ligase-related protein [Streptomyces mirabilis]|uniref:amino acid--tRNA ligase-related protein n=1 Tax=Streptomyces mirabilis TaxID=68239 RepID=UPI002F916C16